MTPGLGERLRDGVLLLDGGMGTALMSRGLAVGASTAEWNREHPDEVLAVHRAHVAAGSQVIQANTFGANPIVLARHGLIDHLIDINREGVRLARLAAGEQRLVAGNIGPSGDLLSPLGGASRDDLVRGFGLQARALADAGADYLAIETMMDLEEALCALQGALRETRLPVTACMTFEHRARGYFTLMGQRPADCARALTEAGAAMVGANCSFGSDEMIGLCRELTASSSVPVVVKPNAGLPEIVDGRTVYRQSPTDFGRDIAEMIASGARAVGGCCGTDARFIAAAATALSSTPARRCDGTGG